MNTVQKIILDIYKEVSKICLSNNIPFYAIGGTCLGAVRHKGFIPWDDDLDIAIPIEYWDYFITLLKENLPENLYVYDSENIKSYHYIWLKVCNKNTTFIEKSQYEHKDAWKGIFIDIMPISGVPIRSRKSFIKKLQILNSLNIYLRFASEPGSIKRLIGRMPFRFLSKILPFQYFSRRYLRILKKNPFYKFIDTGTVWDSNWLPKFIFPIEYFGKGKEILFEDTTIIVPEQVDKYLIQQFGDYMKIPPENERQIHDGIVDPIRPYSYYEDKNLMNY